MYLQFNRLFYRQFGDNSLFFIAKIEASKLRGESAGYLFYDARVVLFIRCHRYLCMVIPRSRYIYYIL